MNRNAICNSANFRLVMPILFVGFICFFPISESNAVSLMYSQDSISADSTDVGLVIPVLSDSLFNDVGVIFLSDFDGWKFTTNDSPEFKEKDYDDSLWEDLNPSDISLEENKNTNDFIKGWFRFKFQLDSTLTSQTLYLRLGTWGASEVYVDGMLQGTFGQVSDSDTSFENYNPLNVIPDEFVTDFEPGKTYTLALRLEDRHTVWVFQYLGIDYRIDPWVRIASADYGKFIQSSSMFSTAFAYSISTALVIILILISSIYSMNKSDPVLRDSALFILILLSTAITEFLNVTFVENLIQYVIVEEVGNVALHMVFGWIPIFIHGILFAERPFWLRVLFYLSLPVALIITFADLLAASNVYITICTLISIWVVFKGRKSIKGENFIILVSIIIELVLIILFIILQGIYENAASSFWTDIHVFIIYLFFPLMLVIYLAVRYTHNFKMLQDKFREVSRLSEEKLNAERDKQKLISQQKAVLEKEVELRTADLSRSLENLQAAQQQLIQQEKLASLGQLTAGIAHEIKNPLNFVNNFSSVSLELIDEAMAEIERLEKTEITEDIADILSSVRGNLEKIINHGTRADRIVKSMLMHSRGGAGKSDLTDVNAVISEYANLAFHGMRASKNPISVDMKLDLSADVGGIHLITEDFSRVVLNVCNNAFDAMREKSINRTTSTDTEYHPELKISSRRTSDSIIIDFYDNGLGISDEIRDKILLPFFTTKKGTEGTGLGLSITHDIIKAHGGQLQIESEIGEWTKFTVILPVQKS